MKPYHQYPLDVQILKIMLGLAFIQKVESKHLEYDEDEYWPQNVSLFGVNSKLHCDFLEQSS